MNLLASVSRMEKEPGCKLGAVELNIGGSNPPRRTKN